MSGNSSPRAASLTGLSPTELDTYAQYAWLSGRVGEAIDLYLDLAQLYRRSPHVHFKLGYLYLSLQDHTAAVKHFSLEIESQKEEVRDPATASSANTQQQRAFLLCTYAGRSDALLALGESTKADNDQLFISNRVGNSAQLLFAMGCLYFRFGMLQRADQCFERGAVVAEDGDPNHLIEHAELRLAQRRYANAASMFGECQRRVSSSSPIYHRALIGQGSALARQNKLQDAVALLLQAMNRLRITIRTAQSAANADHLAVSENTLELAHLYHRSVNLYGGLCLMKGELKAALDTYCSILQPRSSFTDLVPFYLPTICITPGTKTQSGEIVDSVKVSTKNLSEAIRHLNEMEWRYGPDACLYFHRANLHRAIGKFDAFLHDLSLVESIDPTFLSKYVKRDYLGDFLDLETISWIPTKLVESIHDALERNEYRTASTQVAAAAAIPAKGKLKNATGPFQKHRSFSEVAMLFYLQERVKMNKSDDEFAHIFQLDVLRRLPESKRKADQLCALDLAQWEGVIFDNVYSDVGTLVEKDQSLQDAIRSTTSTFPNHPCVHMFAGMIELEKFNVAAAHEYFTQAINLVDRKSLKSPIGHGFSSQSQSSLSERWQQHLLQQAKYYSLVWRSMTCRVQIEMESAVEDLNLAASVRLGDQLTGSDDPLLICQRTLIMLLNGHMKSAYKLLRQLKRSLRLANRNRPIPRGGISTGYDLAEVVDMFSCAGLSTFHLLHLEVQKESVLVASANKVDNVNCQAKRNASTRSEAELDGHEKAQEEREDLGEEASAISMVKYALTKKTTAQTEMLDKFYDAGLLKLSTTGNISQVIPFFQAVLSLDESYLPPTNLASLEIFKCKEQEVMEEKLFNCFVRLGKRSKWLEKKIKWKFEALIDSNLAHSYLPSDMETLWHRARLFQAQKNYVSAINDLSDCLELMSSYYTWERGKKGEKASFNNNAKHTQWLQLQLERSLLFMELHHWEKAIKDLTMVIGQAGKKNPALYATAHEARSSCLVRLKRYGHAIQDLQLLLSLSKEPKKSKKADLEEMRRREDRMMNCILVGNLYCQLAVDHMKSSSALARKTSLSMNLHTTKQAKVASMNMNMITRASEFFDKAEAMVADHFLVHYFRGRMFAISAQSQLATRSLTQCLRLHAMFLPALFLRGCVYAQENLFVLALADFYRVRHRSSTYPSLHTSIGFCHLEQGSLKKAVAAFTEATLQRPDDCDALYMRGCALQEMMVLENALKDFNQVVALKPHSYRAHYQRAVCNILLTNYKMATQAMNTVVRLQPEWRDAWILHGYAHYCAGSGDVAGSSYGTAISLPDPSEAAEKSCQRDSMLFLYRAVCYMQNEKLAHALTDLALALKRDNENYVAFIAKAYCLTKIGDRSRAAQTLAHCLPHYKDIQLPLATKILDSERAKQTIKNESSSETVSSFLQPGVSAIGAALDPPKTTSMVTATPDKLFHYRKQMRDSEPTKCIPPSVLMLGDRPESFSRIGRDRQVSGSNTLEQRRTSTAISPSPPGTTSRKSRLYSTNSTLATTNTAAELDQARAKQVLKAKFLRAMKKITFQYRVLTTLESATSTKNKKSQQMPRALTETLQPPTRVGWPKGTLTSRILGWAFNALGIHHAQEKRMDDALMAFTLAIQSHPLNGDTHFNRGNVYLQIDVLPSAVSRYQDAIDEDDTCFRAYNNMGVAFHKLKRLEEAKDAFSTGLHHAHLPQERAILMYNLGVTFQALERPDEALDFYQQAITLDPTRTEFFNNRSAILHSQLRYVVALEDYNRALRLQNRDSENDSSNQSSEALANGVASRLNRAQLYIAMGNCTLATQDLTVVRDALTGIKYQMKRDAPHDSSTKSLIFTSSASAAAKMELLDADIELVAELLATTRKWHTAMRIAVKDFLFALHALPCIAVYEFSPLFGAELVRLQEREADRVCATDSMDNPAEADRLEIAPLPIPDTSFFDYEREFGHWIVSGDGSDENAEADTEIKLSVRASKREQWAKNYVAHLCDALAHTQVGSFEDAARSLLRAHYKTALDSHDEYLLLTWRVQVTMRIESSNEGSGKDSGLLKAIRVLREFLQDRRIPGEDTGEEDGEEERPPQRSRIRSLGDGDEESELELEWQAQRRVIRADLFVLLGSLYQLNGDLTQARASFQQALRVRSDHAIARLNLLQLSVVLGEYEDALDSCLQILDLFLNIGKAKKTSSSTTMKLHNGLLDADRSVLVMIPFLEHAFEDCEVASLGLQLQSLLKEYRGLVSAQVQANTSLIFKIQGAIAHIVHQLRNHASKRATDDAARAQDVLDREPAQHLDLKGFNETLDEHQDKILQKPSDFRNDPSFDEFFANFQTQFSALCEAVAKTLPVSAAKHDEYSLATQSNSVQDESDHLASEETIEEFLANIERREGQLQRHFSGRIRARPMSTPSGTGPMAPSDNTRAGATPTPRRNSTLTGSSPFQSVRPKSGPQNTSSTRRLQG